jgi:hypothetical protein
MAREKSWWRRWASVDEEDGADALLGEVPTRALTAHEGTRGQPAVLHLGEAER